MVEYPRGRAVPDVKDVASDELLDDGWGHAMAITCTDQPADQIVGVISAGPDGIMGTTDDIVSWSAPAAEPARGASAPAVVSGFGDPYTNVIVPLSQRLLLMGLPYEFTTRARVRLSPKDVAAINTDLALSAYRFVYSTQPTFAQSLKKEPPSRAERLGFFTSPWPSRVR